jgi:hypothetical protein
MCVFVRNVQFCLLEQEENAERNNVGMEYFWTLAVKAINGLSECYVMKRTSVCSLSHVGKLRRGL